MPNHGKKEIITGIHVYLMDVETLILRKMVGRKAFLMKPKHQCHLSQ